MKEQITKKMRLIENAVIKGKVKDLRRLQVAQRHYNRLDRELKRLKRDKGEAGHIRKD